MTPLIKVLLLPAFESQSFCSKSLYSLGQHDLFLLGHGD